MGARGRRREPDPPQGAPPYPSSPPSPPPPRRAAGGRADAHSPRPQESCPHCLNRYENAEFPGGNYCGVTQDGRRGFTDVINYDGGIIAEPPVQAVFEEGQVLDLKFKLTAHHRGHVYAGTCCLDPAATSATAIQECFSANKLTFVEDKLYGANFHPEFPERGYVAPAGTESREARVPSESKTDVVGSAMAFKFRMRLPDRVAGDRCLLQVSTVRPRRDGQARD